MNNLIESISIISIVLASLLASMGYLYRTYIDRKKIIKNVLFNYLELRDTLEKRYMSSDSFQTTVKKYFTAKGINIEEKTLNTILETQISKIKKIDINLNTDDIQRLRNSITELSKVDPIFAYYLNNKERSIELIDNLSVDDTYNHDLFNVILKDINDDILAIAKKVN